MKSPNNTLIEKRTLHQNVQPFGKQSPKENHTERNPQIE